MSSTPFVKFKQDLGDNKFALNTAGYGMTESGIWLPIKVTDEGVQKVQQSGAIVAHGAKIDPVLRIEPGASITLPSCPNIKGYVAIVIGSGGGHMSRLRVDLECSIDDTWDVYGHISTQIFTEFETAKSTYMFRTKTDGKLYGGYHRLRVTNTSSTDDLLFGSWSTLQVETPRSEGL